MIILLRKMFDFFLILESQGFRVGSVGIGRGVEDERATDDDF